MTTATRLMTFFIVFLTYSNQTLGQESSIQNPQTETQFLMEIVKSAESQQYNQKSLVSEINDGANNSDIAPECDPRNFENKVLSKNLNSADYFKELNAYFTKCKSELTTKSTNGIYALYKMATYNYSYLSHPQIQVINIKLENGIQVPAVLALKNDKTPRPLVVVKCGTFCAAEEGPSMRAYMMSLFDQGPFNVIFISSQTGLDYMKANKYISIGGWSEGLEMIEVGTWLKEKWELRDRISSVHLMGISLGGSAAVFGAAYNDLYPQEDGKKVYSSVTAICPVLDLKPTLDQLYASKGVGPIFTKFTKSQFKAARDYLIDVPDLLADELIPRKNSEMGGYLATLASTSLDRRGTDSDETTFSNNNNFWELNHVVKTPLLLWASKDDIVVNNNLNAHKVVEYKYNEKAPNVGLLNMDFGSHCSFLPIYGALAASTVLRTFVLNNSPEYKPNYLTKTKPWQYKFEQLNPAEKHLGQTFHFAQKSDKVKVDFRYMNARNPLCKVIFPWKNTAACIKTKSYNLNVSDLKELGARTPRTSSEAEALTREFNTKVEFRTLEQKPLNGTNQIQFLIAWKTGFE